MNPTNEPSSLDYLNQIAPQQPKRPVFELNMRNVIIGGIILVVAVILLSVITSLFSGGQKESWHRLNARLATTATVVDEAGSNVKNSQLRMLNSDLKLQLANIRRDLPDVLSQLNVSAEPTASIIAQESSEEMDARLEDGRLNAKFDSTYAREMTYQLAILLTHIEQLASSSSGGAEEFLVSAYNNLLPTYEGFQDFSTANE